MENGDFHRRSVGLLWGGTPDPGNTRNSLQKYTVQKGCKRKRVSLLINKSNNASDDASNSDDKLSSPNQSVSLGLCPPVGGIIVHHRASSCWQAGIWCSQLVDRPIDREMRCAAARRGGLHTWPLRFLLQILWGPFSFRFLRRGQDSSCLWRYTARYPPETTTMLWRLEHPFGGYLAVDRRLCFSTSSSAFAFNGARRCRRCCVEVDGGN